MPWTPEQFSSKHNHKLSGKAARGASEVANKELAKGASDATAIRIGNVVGDRVMSHEGGGTVAIKTFPIPSKPAPSGGEDNSRAYAKGGPLDNVVGGYGGSDQKKPFLQPAATPPVYKPFPDEAPQPKSMACGGMIKHASYANGGAVGNSSMKYAKGGFKSNAGDFH